jgi:hypothetical protein
MSPVILLLHRNGVSENLVQLPRMALMVISGVAPNLQARNVSGMKISSGDVSILLQPAERIISRLNHLSNSTAYWGGIPIHPDTSNDEGSSRIPRDRGLLPVFVQFRHVISVVNRQLLLEATPKRLLEVPCRQRGHHVMLPYPLGDYCML